MPSWRFGAHRAALRALPRQRAERLLPYSSRLRRTTNAALPKELKPVRIRMGVHLGPVVVGDIGTASRINYTIVGDAVNATQRLESLGKTIDPDAEAIALVSEGIFAAAPAGFQFIERGAHLVKGKQESLKVFQLIGGPEESTSAATMSDRTRGS